MAANTSPSSRRALLAGTAAGLAVAAAGQLARPLSALAEDGDAVRVGDTLTAESTTAITNNTTSATVLSLESTQGTAIEAKSKDSTIIADSTDSTAIWGRSQRWIAVQGDSYGEPDSNDPKVVGIGVMGAGPQTGVHGQSTAGFGVAGITETGEGVHASASGVSGVAVSASSPSGIAVEANSDAGPAVRAGSLNGSAIFAWSHGEGQDVAAMRGEHAEGDGIVGWSKTTTGVRGLGENEANGVTGKSHAVGVEGRTTGTTTEEDMFQANVIGVSARVDGPDGFGIAVKGDGANGCGVLGQGGHCGVHGYGDKAGVEGKSLPGVGVSGNTQDGYAVAANVFPGGSGVALIAHGPVIFDSAGLGNLVGGRAKVTPGVTIDGASKVFIALMGSPGAQAQVPYVEVTPGPAGTGFFRVRLPGARATAIPFAYFVIS